MSYIGADLHTNSFTICHLETGGNEVLVTYQLGRSDLEQFCLTLNADNEIAVEATGNSAWFCEEVRPCVSQIVAVNPRQFQVIRASVKKTNKHDEYVLALLLSKDMPPETRLKSRVESELASLSFGRDFLVKQRVRLINKIHTLSVRYGLKLKKGSLNSQRTLIKLDIAQFSPLEQAELRILRDQALSLIVSTQKMDMIIAEAEQALDGYDSLMGIKGIGPCSAAIFPSAPGNVNDFESADKLSAYFGIVPRVSQSNDIDNRVWVTKRGNKPAHTTLMQCTLSTIRYSGYLNSFYRRIKDKVLGWKGNYRSCTQTTQHYLRHPKKWLDMRGFYNTYTNKNTNCLWTIIIGASS
ncbi:MAG: IS110 family transposase [Alphaproteobacteria bacterium]|nr:IS110 family transposase [Alphaproteobacteria bacterium]